MCVPADIATHDLSTGLRFAVVIPDAPSLDDLRVSAKTFNGYANPDRSWARFCELTAPAVDLARAEHRAALHEWLNAWGCRVRYPRPEEPLAFDEGIAAWWAQWAARLPQAPLVDLDDGQVDELSAAFGALSATTVAPPPRGRTLGPTAAAKALYALVPAAAMPWDAAIAAKLHGARDAAAFGRHLRLGRQWARAVLDEAGSTEEDLAALVGRPGHSLAKLLDEYCYLAFTLGSPVDKS
jgi:hypothetical protein